MWQSSSYPINNGNQPCTKTGTNMCGMGNHVCVCMRFSFKHFKYDNGSSLYLSYINYASKPSKSLNDCQWDWIWMKVTHDMKHFTTLLRNTLCMCIVDSVHKYRDRHRRRGSDVCTGSIVFLRSRMIPHNWKLFNAIYRWMLTTSFISLY